MQAMKINFIITASGREDYLPYLLAIIRGLPGIRPNIVVCYNGVMDDFPCQIRQPNPGLQEGDVNLTLAGYEYHLHMNSTRRFVKLAIDSWILDAHTLVGIFNRMMVEQCGYAGNHWHKEGDHSYATDIIISDLAYGNVFRKLGEPADDMESRLWKSCRDQRIHVLKLVNRVPVHPHHRFECRSLGWTMHHELQRNLENARSWGYGALIENVNP